MNIPLAQRLIIAADFGNQNSDDAIKSTISLAKSVKGSGVILKSNAVLRAAGYSLIDQVRDLGLGFFADLKLSDIPNTLESDGRFLQEKKPELLTAMASTGSKGLSALVDEIPDTEVLGVTFLTSLKDEDAQELHGRSNAEETVDALARIAQRGRVGGLILSPLELPIVRNRSGLTFNTPGIRPAYSLVEGDDQSRVTTPADAIKAGATRIVVGRPITQSDDPQGAIEKILNEIQDAVESSHSK